MGKACEIKFRFGADAFQDPPLCRSTSCGAATTLQGKSHFCIPFLGIARPQSQFPHSCVCERFIYSKDQSTYFPATIGRPIHKSLRYMNVGTGRQNIIILFWIHFCKYINGNQTFILDSQWPFICSALLAIHVTINVKVMNMIAGRKLRTCFNLSRNNL